MRPLLLPALILFAHIGGCAVGTDSHPSEVNVHPSAMAASAGPSANASVTASTEPTPVPNDQDGVTSDAGLFVGSWSSNPGTPPVNALHEWVLHIETPDGVPVEGALVTVDGDMPAHGHGMPTVPEVTADLGDGDYRVEGMQFQMGGYWVIDVSVTSDGQTDRIRFGLEL